MIPEAFVKGFGTAVCGVCDTCNRLGSVVSAAAHSATGIANAILYPLSEIGSLFMSAPTTLLLAIAAVVVIAVSIAAEDEGLANDFFSTPTVIVDTPDAPSTTASGNSFRERAGRHFEAAKDLLTYAATGDNKVLDSARKNTMLGNRIEGILKFFNLGPKEPENPNPGLR